MSTQTDLEAAANLIAAHLHDHPEDSDLVPGYRLVPAPLSEAQRVALTIPLATAARRAKNGERVRKISEIIRNQMDANPAITDQELATVLNDSGLKTYKGLLWSDRTIAAFKRTAIDKPPAP